MEEENNGNRLTIDTSVVISGTISPHNFSSKLLSFWTQDLFTWVQTPSAFSELQEVLQREKLQTKYHIKPKEAQIFLNSISIGVEFVFPIAEESLPIHCRDKKDDKFLACALGGSCDYLISDDEDLLVLNGSPELGELKIIPAKDYLRIISK